MVWGPGVKYVWLAGVVTFTLPLPSPQSISYVMPGITGRKTVSLASCVRHLERKGAAKIPAIDMRRCNKILIADSKKKCDNHRKKKTLKNHFLFV